MKNEPPSFLAELSRRKMFRTAIIYLGVTWALLQFADLAFPRLELPDWTVTFVMIISMIGFPIVLVATWAFDYDHSEIDSATANPGSHKMSPLRGLALLVIIALSVAVGHFYYTRLGPSSEQTPMGQAQTNQDQGVNNAAEHAAQAGETSIAVLPFVNMSGDPANEYFSDGISEELLDALAKLKKLRVVARTSSFSFKGSNRDIRAIAQALNVSTILEGSVRKAGNSVRITAQLINAEDGYHLWSDTYDRELTDIFAVQDEIAQSIVDALQIPLGLDRSTDLVFTGTQNIEAYNEYLRGLHFSKLFSQENIDQAIVHLNNAVTLDPQYAAPYGLLANLYTAATMWTSAEVVMPLAVRAFETALQLDPTQGLALTTKAQYLTITQWDWLQAKEYFVRALEDETEKSWAAFWYTSLHLLPLGAFDEARVVLATAEASDPIDSRLKLASASLSLFEQDIPGAIAGYAVGVTLDPDNAQAASGLCTAYVYAGDIAAADVIIQQWQEKLGYTHPWILNCRAIREMALNQSKEALASYHELVAMLPSYKGVSFLAGDLALAVDKIDEAMDWYDRSLADSEIGILMIRSRLAKQPAILAHPRMLKILRTMRLDDASLEQMGYLDTHHGDSSLNSR